MSLTEAEQKAIEKARAKALAFIEAEAERHGRFMNRAFKRPERTQSKRFVREKRGMVRGAIGAASRKGLVQVN